MIKKIAVGMFSGTIIGMLITSFFLSSMFDMLWSKITATSIIVGMLTSIYGHLSKSRLQVFIISIFIGVIVFYVKYWITGHYFDPAIMGAFTGALLGVIYAIGEKINSFFKA
ncbi:hypothetical protein N9839_03915 [Flavobacteriaceae bacterium]|nr:hypothetical protein [Flavobacteriaceae bacterium]